MKIWQTHSLFGLVIRYTTNETIRNTRIFTQIATGVLVIR
jgi:hypothetical protein